MALKIKLGVVFGGKSVEHEISVISAMQAIEAVDRDKYDVVPIYIAKDGKMYTGSEMADLSAYRDLDRLLEQSVQVFLAGDKGRASLVRAQPKLLHSAVLDTVDVILPVVHGTNVEDGALQGFFRTIGVPFAGCDVLASAVGMDKAASKAVMKVRGIPVLDGAVVRFREYGQDPDAEFDRVEALCQYPVIVKPVNLGSSVGIKKADSREGLQKAFDYAFTFADRVLVERAVQELREINCSVLGDKDGVRTSVCEEPLHHDEILSYADKYLSGNAKGGTKTSDPGGMVSLKRKLPAEIPEDLEKKVRELAAQAFLALDCSGVARVDFLYDKTDGTLFVNELNTIPGSLSYYLWEATGLPFQDLLEELIRLALKRQRETQELTYTFETNILSTAGMSGSKGAKR